MALATDSGISNTDGITNVGTINVTGLEAGATWQYSTNAGTSWTAGTGTSFVLAAGTYASGSVQVKQIDVAGNTSTIGNSASAITVDTTAAAAPSTALATDSGASGSDRITNVGTMNVTGLEAGTTWQYSTNSGTSWTAGTGTTFVLAAGTYAANSVQVKQTDAAGNTSSVGKVATAITVDIVAATPSMALAVDSGNSNSDGITNEGTINVTGLEAGTAWQYSTNSGNTWTVGTGTTFVLAAGTYAANSVQAKQTDAAGNASGVGKVATDISVVITTVAAPSLTLATDSGTSNTDGITNVGTINVTGIEAGATWQYSTNSGASWTTGTGTSFVLAAGPHAANSV
jgi:hypothetical protein